MDKLSINNEMAVLDAKDRGFYDSLSPEEKKKFSIFLMLRYGSSVTGITDLQAYYLQSTNLRLNKNFFDIPKKHEKLNWLAATTISPGMGSQRHEWISAPKKSKDTGTKAEKFLTKCYPSMKASDIKVMAAVLTPAEIKNMAKEYGMMPDQIKKELT